MDDKEGEAQQPVQDQVSYTPDDYASEDEKLDSDRFPNRFGLLSPTAQRLYVEQIKDGKVRKEDELLEQFRDFSGKELKNMPKGKSRVFPSIDGTKVLKIDEFSGMGYKDLAEGPLIGIVREVLTEAGDNPNFVPAVFEFGITEKGDRYTITEMVEGERIFQPEYKFRSPEQRPPTPQEFVELIDMYTEMLPLLESHGVFKVADIKQDDVFLTPDGKMRMIDWDVAWTGKMPYEKQVARTYGLAAENFLDLAQGIMSGGIRETRIGIDNIDTVCSYLAQTGEKPLEILLLASLTQFLAGKHEIKVTHSSAARAIDYYRKLKSGEEVAEEGVSSELAQTGKNYGFMRSSVGG